MGLNQCFIQSIGSELAPILQVPGLFNIMCNLSEFEQALPWMDFTNFLVNGLEMFRGKTIFYVRHKFLHYKVLYWVGGCQENDDDLYHAYCEV